MKEPKYPKTPMRNCLYCKLYNPQSNTCTAPRSEDDIANFYPRMDADCPKFRYDKSENPELKPMDFVEKYCLGKKCPFYYETIALCTRPSKCPYVEEEKKSVFDNLDFDKEL